MPKLSIKSDKIEVRGGKVTLKPELVEEIETRYNIVSVEIRSKIDGIAKLTGTVSGNVYIWNGYGSVQDVDIRDKDEIINKKRGKACCGGDSYTSLFEILE